MPGRRQKLCAESCQEKINERSPVRLVYVSRPLSVARGAGAKRKTLRLPLHIKSCQALAAHRLPQFEEPAGFDLPNPFPRDAVAAGHFIQGPRASIS